MTTRLLFREDAYLADAPGVVTGHTPEGGILVDQTPFYPTGGGQPGDSGWIAWEGRRLSIATAVKVEGGLVALVPAEPMPLPPVGAPIHQHLDWTRRHRHMRVHTALHLLSVVIPLPVTGGQIGSDRGRLDFDMPDPPDDLEVLEDRLNAIIGRDLPVREEWITDATQRPAACAGAGFGLGALSSRLAARSSAVTVEGTPPSGTSRPLVHTSALSMSRRNSSFCQLAWKWPPVQPKPRPPCGRS